MKKIGFKLKRRLRSRSGESITEVLVALLVSTLGIVLLAGMINSSTIMINKSKDKIAAFVQAGVNVVEQKNDDPTPDTAEVEFKQNNADMILYDGDEGVKVEYFENDEAGNITVKSYKVVNNG